MKENSILGIDVSKATLDIALLQDETYQTASFANTKSGLKKLRGFLQKNGAQGCPVVLEATGTYGDLAARTTHSWKAPVYIVNPSRIKAHRESMGKKNKTDLEDAKVIAHFGTCHEMTLWEPPLPNEEALQALTRRLHTLKKTRSQEQNREKSGRLTESVSNSIQQHIAFLNMQIKALEEEIDEHIDSDPKSKKQADLLQSIPGIGRTTAAQFLAEVPKPMQFKSARALGAFAGLAPKAHQSGTSVSKRGKITKAGGFRLRAMLYMPAISAMQHNPTLKALAERLKKKGKESMVIIVAVMRKLLHLMFGVLKSERPFDPNYLANIQDAA